jgi:hydrogenase maturation protein HypF
VPYDRPLTTMAGFSMCRACQAEYDDPGDRRFHAQPNGCAACGPRPRLLDPAGAEQAGDPLAATVAALRAGQIVAVKAAATWRAWPATRGRWRRCERASSARTSPR